MAQSTERALSLHKPSAADISMGLGVAAWYALPDLVRTRRVRALIKVVGIAGIGALGIRNAAAEQHVSTVGEPHSSALDLTPESAAATARAFADARAAATESHDDGRLARLLDGSRPGAAGVLAVVALTGSVACTVLVERGIFRLGERLRGAGCKAPHVMIGVALGAVAAVTGMGRAIKER